MAETKLQGLKTRWSGEAKKTVPLAEYPRPQLERDSWLCLNGRWNYAIRPLGADREDWDGEIIVPYSPESRLSGVGRQLQPGEVLFYEKIFSLEPVAAGKRLILHFGAVDQWCEVSVNGRRIGEHRGGYLPFSFDITHFVCPGENRLSLRVTDDSDQGDSAYGKQKLRRGGIWYTAQSGIWQTVWLEEVPEVYVRELRITPKFHESQVEICVHLGGNAPQTGDENDSLPETGAENAAAHTVPVRVKVLDSGRIAAEGETADGCICLSIADKKAWSPEDPFLYDVVVEAGDDRVTSYFGMREFGFTRGAQGRKVLALNGKPLFHHGLLDQGYWSDGLYTPPSDEAMVWEITRLKQLGFNMLRKHIKIEPLRWYYHCDRLGILVWQDFVSGGGPYSPLIIQALPWVGIQLKDDKYKTFGRASENGRKAFVSDAKATISHLYNCVSLCCWVPFNEGWGQFDAAETAEMVRAMDPTRYIDHASGYHDQGAGDFQSSHVYYKKYRTKTDAHDRVMALTEFGGYSLPSPGHMTGEKEFGYKIYKSQAALEAAILSLYRREVLPAIRRGLSADVYTQVSDVEDEINGMFSYDRAVEKLSVRTGQTIRDEIEREFGE